MEQPLNVASARIVFITLRYDILSWEISQMWYLEVSKEKKIKISNNYCNIRGMIPIPYAGKKRRITLVECGNDINCMIDLAKVADLVRKSFDQEIILLQASHNCDFVYDYMYFPLRAYFPMDTVYYFTCIERSS